MKKILLLMIVFAMLMCSSAFADTSTDVENLEMVEQLIVEKEIGGPETRSSVQYVPVYHIIEYRGDDAVRMYEWGDWYEYEQRTVPAGYHYVIVDEILEQWTAGWYYGTDDHYFWKRDNRLIVTELRRY